MLSPHEIANLMLLRDGCVSIELDPANLDALLERRIVPLEKRRAATHAPSPDQLRRCAAEREESKPPGAVGVMTCWPSFRH